MPTSLPKAESSQATGFLWATSIYHLMRKPHSSFKPLIWLANTTSRDAPKVLVSEADVVTSGKSYFFASHLWPRRSHHMMPPADPQSSELLGIRNYKVILKTQDCLRHESTSTLDQCPLASVPGWGWLVCVPLVCVPFCEVGRPSLLEACKMPPDWHVPTLAWQALKLIRCQEPRSQGPCRRRTKTMWTDFQR